MNVISVEASTSEIVEMEGREYSTFRRISSDYWEVQMGESWEPVYFEQDELEKAYQRFVQ